MKRFLLTILIIIIVLGGTGAGLVYAYQKSDDFSSEKFEDNFYINGVDCSGLTYEEASEKLTKEWNKKVFTVNDADGNKLKTYSFFGCTYTPMDELKSIKEDNFLMAALNHYIHNKVEFNVTMPVDSYSEAFKKQVTSSDFLDQTEDITESHNAYVDTSDSSFPIVEEVYGDNIDKDRFFDKVISRIEKGKFTLKFNAEDYYAEPDILSDNEDLLAYQKFCQEKLSFKIVYEFGDKDYTVSTEDLANMYVTDGSGDVNSDAVKEFVKNLADKYDNVGIKRSLTTVSGKKVNVSGGTYGWEIDQDKEAEQLKKDLESMEDAHREAQFSNTGYTSYSDGIGNTYIDVDLTKQTVYLYQNGKTKFKCEVVTGDKSQGKATPEGTYYLKNKLRDVTMRGTNSDGSTYEVPASYWMGITPNGIGFHDSNWRTEFGGDIWKTNGSHGCVNMPKDKIPNMYKLAEVNMPVIMHY